MNKNETGRSTLEILSILAIAVFVSLGAVAGYSKAVNRYKTGKIIDQVTTLSDNIRTHFAQKISYEDVSTETIIKNPEILPHDIKIISEEQTLKHPFGGKILITSGQLGYGVSGIKNDKKAFLIKYTGLPREACTILASYDWSSHISSGLMGFKVTGKKSHKNVDEITDIIGSEGIEFQDNGIACTGVSATAGNVVACIGGITAIPLSLAQAGIACNCSSKNNCTITWKYY